MEYSKLAPVATTVIEPSSIPQLEGSTEITLVMIGSTLSVMMTSASDTTQVPSTFLTLIAYVPPAKSVNAPEPSQVVPPSMEY